MSLQLGMTLPVMEPDLWERGASTLEDWSRFADDAGFSTLCFGERMAFDNPHTLTLLGAVASWTHRIELITTVIVPQLHEPVPLAKALATGDQLSGGRLTVGLGVGGREEDYRAAGADFSTQTMRQLAERAAVMRRVWVGEKVTDAVRAVGPPPTREGGPSFLVGSMGPKTIRSAAAWADGLAGVTLDLDATATASLYDVARDAWADAGKPAPRLTTSFWFAIGEPDEARQQVHAHLRHYMNWIPSELVDAMAPDTGFAGTIEELREVLDRFEQVGTEQVHLIPTSSDLSQVERVAEALL